MSKVEPTNEVSASYPPPPTATSQGRGYTIGGFICAVIALVFLPIVLGPLGAVLGYVGYRKGDPLGRWALIAAIAATVIGLLLAALVLQAGNDATAR